MMPAFAMAAENRQSGIRLLCVADAARLGAAGEIPASAASFSIIFERLQAAKSVLCRFRLQN